MSIRTGTQRQLATIHGGKVSSLANLLLNEQSRRKEAISGYGTYLNRFRTSQMESQDLMRTRQRELGAQGFTSRLGTQRQMFEDKMREQREATTTSIPEAMLQLGTAAGGAYALRRQQNILAGGRTQRETAFQAHLNKLENPELIAGAFPQQGAGYSPASTIMPTGQRQVPAFNRPDWRMF